jgi:hypothetical protein
VEDLRIVKPGVYKDLLSIPDFNGTSSDEDLGV